MNRSIAWKLIITFAVVAWAVAAMIPFKDTPFDDYIRVSATAHQEEFANLLDQANSLVDAENHASSPDKYPTLFIALREYSNKNQIDLAKFFPDINVRDINVLTKRNNILIKELYKRSKSAIKQGLDLQGGVSFTLAINDEELSTDSENRSTQLESVLNVINSRVNGLGVTEPTIRVIGANSVEVQMPGVSLKDNPEAIEELSRPAKLEFKVGHRTITPSSARPPLSEIPVGYDLMIMESERGNQLTEIPMYVKRIPEASGDIIAKAGVALEGVNQFIVTMSFTPDGSKQFEKITRTIFEKDRETGTRQPLAIVLDGKLISAPGINQVISEHGQISGNFTHREAVELANALNNPLAFGLTRTSLNEVGPSLAEDSRAASLFAAFMATMVVIVFMLLYYQIYGVTAVLTVALNVVILVGVLASFGATMTLPGIAALALTVGMAVDANILIFERMREEFKLGKSLWNSLQEGYKMAMSTIIDANLTTLLIAIILWKFGTGPIKGFGVTLAVGIGTTLFCALVFNRALLEMLVKMRIIRKGFSFSLIKNETNFKFLKYAKVSCIACIALFAFCLTVIVQQGSKSLGVDFTGGESLTVGFEKKLSINEIQALSSEIEGLEEIQVAFQTDIVSRKEFLNLQTQTDKGDLLFASLVQKFPDAGLTLIAKESIGATVSKSITRDAIIACALAMLIMLLYVAFRFELGYGMGALVSTAHDLFLTIGIYIVLGKFFGIGAGQFSAPMIAAILMTVGYSINDTIVVFDRIREELKMRPTMALKDIIDLSINKTLSRTILTSTTTFLAALALYIFGTGLIKDFSLVFVIGIAVGTFSSIYIASPIFYWWHKGSRKNVEDKEFKTNYEWQEEK